MHPRDLPALLMALCTRLVLRTRRLRSHPQAGDVPGWVMVTLMSALLVAAVYAVAGPALTDVFKNAIDQINGLE